MSFSGEVKKELAQIVPSSRHCRIAGLAALLQCIGEINEKKDKSIQIEINTENEEAARKCFTLLQKTININDKFFAAGDGTPHAGRTVRTITLDKERGLQLLGMLKLMEADGSLRTRNKSVSALLLKNACCQRAFLRETFLCIGSMSDPGKEYHLEYVCTAQAQAEQIETLLREQGASARQIRRKKYYVVYLKDSTGIVTLLNLMGAHVALMNMENSRILKEMRNSINRRVNCETANIEKTVTASQKQIEDIQLIRSSRRDRLLPENLRQMAELRLQYPDATLKELGNLLDPPIGKSGVNHRLRKLSELADSLREQP
ncbi:MAG: DNA-binding protein WhiA [Eubacteriales bacterium]|nr:DNA-binding protein WhiA [Eubacteriales bacterium]